MKKVFFLVISCMLAGAFNTTAQKVAFGLQGNLVGSWLQEDNANIDREGMRIGYGYGLILDYNFAENYGLSTGLNIKSNAGSKLKYIPNVISDTGYSAFTLGDSIIPLDDKATVAYKIQYIEVPLSLKLKTNEIGYITYYGQFGFTPQVLWKARGGTYAEDADITKSVRRIGISLNFGGGIHYSLGGKTYIIAGIIFDNGLIDITDNYERYKNFGTPQKTDEKMTDKVIMNAVSLRVGVMF